MAYDSFAHDGLRVCFGVMVPGVAPLALEFNPFRVVEPNTGARFNPFRVVEPNTGARFSPFRVVEPNTGARFSPFRVVESNTDTRFSPFRVVESNTDTRFNPFRVEGLIINLASLRLVLLVALGLLLLGDGFLRCFFGFPLAVSRF
jgi:hypothetical protein